MTLAGMRAETIAEERRRMDKRACWLLVGLGAGVRCDVMRRM